MNLSKAQTEAVLHNKGPMLVLAGPGSGKTAVIAQRTVQLIRTYQIPPHDILVITFTRAAAGNMKERFLKYVGLRDTAVHFSTLHSLFFKILCRYTNLRSENILSEDQKQELIRKIIRSLKISTDDHTELIKQSILDISVLKNDPINQKIDHASLTSSEYFKDIYFQYSDYLKKNRLLDLDDLIIYCYRLLLYKPEVLSACQRRFRYLLIDEFQDISPLQYEIVKLLAKPENNLFVVGDDDQSIYSFRGADPKIMLDFPKDYPDTRMIRLDVNYRSGPKIVMAAEKIIHNNKNRYDKTLISFQNHEDKIFLIDTANLYKQNRYIVEKLLGANEDLSRFAVLSRTNKELTGIINLMIRHNIPFAARDGTSNIFRSMTSIDILSYMEAADQLRSSKEIDKEVFIRIMNKPVRYIERAGLRGKTVTQTSLQRTHITKHWAFGKITALFDDLNKLAKLSPKDAIDFIYLELDYRTYLKEYCSEQGLLFEEFEESIWELKDFFQNFNDLKELKEFINNFESKLHTNSSLPQKKAVTVSTFHSAKGLEFDHVIIVNCINGITPYIKSSKKSSCNIEEERRLFYVAITRAKKNLFLIAPRTIYGKKKERSIFIDELIKDGI